MRPHRRRIAVVCDRLPHGVEHWSRASQLEVVRSLDHLQELVGAGRVDLALLDTSIAASAGGFDAIDAARLLHKEVRSGGEGFEVVLFTDGTESAVHVAEEVEEYLQRERIANYLAGTACGNAACMDGAVTSAMRRERWSDQHRSAAQAVGRSVLFQEMQVRNAFPEIFVAMATHPSGWGEMATRLHRSEGALRNELSRTVQPALIRLGWERETEPPELVRLASHVNRRRDYVVRYAKRYRSDLAHLVAA